MRLTLPAATRHRRWISPAPDPAGSAADLDRGRVRVHGLPLWQRLLCTVVPVLAVVALGPRGVEVRGCGPHGLEPRGAQRLGDP